MPTDTSILRERERGGEVESGIGVGGGSVSGGDGKAKQINSQINRLTDKQKSSREIIFHVLTLLG